MVRIEISDKDGRSFGRVAGIERCFDALRKAGVARYSIKVVGDMITSHFSGQAQDCSIRPTSCTAFMGVEMVDGSVGGVRLWIDENEVEA